MKQVSSKEVERVKSSLGANFLGINCDIMSSLKERNSWKGEGERSTLNRLLHRHKFLHYNRDKNKTKSGATWNNGEKIK